jgi:uncharacterized ferritin-like protein (DUF455 family)
VLDIIAMMELRQHAMELLMLSDPGAKVEGTRALLAHLRSGCRPDPDAMLDEPAQLPGRPDRPLLVAPSRLARRSTFTVGGRAALLHALAHIEFNAINLALDAIWRFAGMPEAFYVDWARVASEEAHHFGLLAGYLSSLGHRYGDFDAHDGLWEMAEQTRHDVIARMALVPRTLEARGLDVTPAMRSRFARAGDAHAVEILDLILRDEIGHVAIGNRWFRWSCERARVDPIEHYELLAMRHHAPVPRPPFNREARAAAGFTEDELDRLAR